MKPRFSHIISIFSAILLAIPVPAQETSMKLRTVVIDAGHGGKDAGCVSKDRKTYEKNIALDISKRLAQKISAAYPDVQVKMTRSDDRFVELENRAVFANKANANLFICIHVNAVDGSTSANGYSIHCLGQSKKKGNDLYSKNLDLVKRENSVIKLENNYAATYQGFDPDDPSSSIIFSLMQSAHLGQSLEFAADVASAMEGGPIKTNRGVSQDPFWVLWRTAMPAVLIEVGFITNPQDLAVMRSEVGRDQIAQNIFKAFRVYKARYDREEAPAEPVVAEDKIADQVGNDAPAVTSGKEPEADPSVISTAAEGGAEKSPATESAKVLSGVQILVSSKDMPDSDPFFAGYKPMKLVAGKYFKYVIELSPKLQEVKQKYSRIQKIFPDSFIVKVSDGSAQPLR